jgi:single-strand DNA-binding protein
MATVNLSRAIVTGNLTRDVELRHTPGGTAVTTLRVACNTRRKNQQGEWVDKRAYFDVEVWGVQAENAARCLGKGSAVGVDGKLEWREWEQEGAKRERVFVRAEAVQFLDRRDGDGARRTTPGTEQPVEAAPSQPDSGQAAAAGAEELPF